MLEHEDIEVEEQEEAWLEVDGTGACKGGGAGSGSVSVIKPSSPGEGGEIAVETRGSRSFSCEETSFLRRRLPEYE